MGGFSICICALGSFIKMRPKLYNSKNLIKRYNTQPYNNYTEYPLTTSKKIIFRLKYNPLNFKKLQYTLSDRSDVEYNPMNPNGHYLVLQAKQSFSLIAKYRIKKEKKRQGFTKNCENRSAFKDSFKEHGQKGVNHARKIMERLGWRPGFGLGKNKQGITAALVVHKVDPRIAIITNFSANETRVNLAN